ncbi:CU044_2847 family protein [Streptomyces odonnellii]|uniref:CU044_2847 family protein n=1 Tax=Streptomyces odonnellii TaxID=1417980 RepID=UPI000625F7EB|nr:CU044_2847 family protein [Streptomyces odonnellii]
MDDGEARTGDVRITRVEMPDGTPVWARISGAEELGRPSGGLTYADTGFAERVQARVESLHGVVTSVARSLAEPLRAVRPDEVSVEFGIELTAKAGKVVGLLADGEAKGTIKVTLTWNGGPPADLTDPPQVPAQAAGASGTAVPGSTAAPPGPPAAPAPGGAPQGAPAHSGGPTPPAGSGP